eukprot:TRINITY_DN9461_c0_g1_i3.p1 TRINITY_DN9461_c0_g1~~TRINITY_DN9461_c0_g1_i3.p1  ORF type:complete len:489 (+),score=67.39 TRINITY_DN9461_c0_g1_i3:68-1534(+)
MIRLPLRSRILASVSHNASSFMCNAERSQYCLSRILSRSFSVQQKTCQTCNHKPHVKESMQGKVEAKTLNAVETQATDPTTNSTTDNVEIDYDPAVGLYRRPLPQKLIPFSSAEGKKLFREAMEQGYLEGYFTLAEQYTTQSEPAYCGLGTLSMVLNSLQLDPNRLWKGPWRWFSEDMLDCCKPLSVVKKEGITFSEFSCLARCNGAHVREYRGEESSEEQFRQHVIEATTKERVHLVTSFSRKALGQTGDGHFSPIGAYHNSDQVLVLDVARFKYPPYWCNLTDLWLAMRQVDAKTGRSRGYFLVDADPDVSCSTFCTIQLDTHRWQDIARHFCQTLPDILKSHSLFSIQDMVYSVLHHLPPELSHVLSTYTEELRGELSQEHRDQLHSLFSDLSQNQLFRIVKNTSERYISNHKNHPIYPNANAMALLTQTYGIETTAILLLSCPGTLYQTLPQSLQIEMNAIRDLDSMPRTLRQVIMSNGLIFVL